jgi:acyl-CoA synthetase (AMP-forming)/AMP-acid ligase II
MVAVSGAARAGLCVASISSRLTSAEIDDIVRGAEAKALVITAAIGPAFGELPARLPGVVLFATGGAVAGFRDWDRERQAQSTEPLAPGGPCRHH